jgi:hypothetical protein
MDAVESTLWMYVWLGVLVFLLRKDIAEEWRTMHPRPPRLPPPAGGHWVIRGRMLKVPPEGHFRPGATPDPVGAAPVPPYRHRPPVPTVAGRGEEVCHCGRRLPRRGSAPSSRPHILL